MIRVDNISKKFTKQISNKKSIEFYADQNISFEAKDGEILGILGPNGAGKTTLLRILAGIMKPTEGNVIIDNLNYKDNEIQIKKSLAFLSGNTKLYKDLSPYELFIMCGEYYDIKEELLNERIDMVTKRFSLGDFLHQKIEKLSTGQLQRVNIARCLIHNPKYYIFDEATSGLDILSSKVILDFIKEEKENNKCVIYSTHYMEEAENICDRVILVHKGKIIKEGTPESIVKETNTTNLRDAFFALIGGSENE